MNPTLDALTRLVAFAQARAEPVTQSTLMGADPADVFAVTFVKIVSEDAVQAIAYGTPGTRPSVLVRWNPMSRESGDLAPFAEALNAYLQRCFDQDLCPRVWIAHEAARHLVDLLGHRYRRNPHATAQMQQMGVELRALEEEAQIPGQQVVAVAGNLLREHYVTGQSPQKDLHLGALLHWILPPVGASVAEVAAGADEIALVPATNVLPDSDDDLAERLRRNVKRARGRGRDRDRLEQLLRRAVVTEWDLLMRARDAWLSADVTPVPESAALAGESLRRLRWNCGNGTPTLSFPGSLSRRLETHAAAQETADALTLVSDENARRAARTSGRVIEGTVTGVAQPTPNRFPCRLRVVSVQPVVRVRVGTVLVSGGGNLTATVQSVGTDDQDRWVIVLNVTRGARTPPAVGQVTQWSAAPPPNLTFSAVASDTATHSANHPLATGEPLPLARPRVMPDDLLERARAMRTPR